MSDVSTHGQIRKEVIKLSLLLCTTGDTTEPSNKSLTFPRGFSLRLNFGHDSDTQSLFEQNKAISQVCLKTTNIQDFSSNLLSDSVVRRACWTPTY